MSKVVPTGRNGKTLHVDEDCQNIRHCNTREASEQEVEIFDKCKTCHVMKQPCEHCGEEFTPQGLGSHENHCDQNPEPFGYRIPVLD